MVPGAVDSSCMLIAGTALFSAGNGEVLMASVESERTRSRQPGIERFEDAQNSDGRADSV